MRIMDWLKQIVARAPQEPPQRIFDLWRQDNAELEDAKQRVARLKAEMEARNLRTQP